MGGKGAFFSSGSAISSLELALVILPALLQSTVWHHKIRGFVSLSFLLVTGLSERSCWVGQRNLPISHRRQQFFGTNSTGAAYLASEGGRMLPIFNWRYVKEVL